MIKPQNAKLKMCKVVSTAKSKIKIPLTKLVSSQSKNSIENFK